MKKIESLQSLRGIAFLGIFLSHADFAISWSGLGVAIFLVLSGFLLMYKWEPAVEKLNVRYSFNEARKRIVKVYPLHIVTTIAMVLLTAVAIFYNGFMVETFFELIGEIILNVFLIQSWYPNLAVNVSLNGVSWYLSTALFCYFLFLFVADRIQKARTSRLVALVICVITAQIAFSALILSINGGDYDYFFLWGTYCFPIFRFGDFLIGCCLGKQLSKKKGHEATITTFQKILYSIGEIGLSMLTILVSRWNLRNHSTIIGKAISNWTTTYMIMACFWVAAFYYKKGIITHFLDNICFRFIGNISGELFLIHFVVIMYINNLLNHLNNITWERGELSLVCVEFIVSVLLTVMYDRFIKGAFVEKSCRN